MIKVYCDGARIRCLRQGNLNVGMVGTPVEFDFSSEWDGLGKIAVFRCDGERDMIIGADGKTTVPHEILTTPGMDVEVGVYSVKADGTTWPAPTTYCKIGTVKEGADPSGDESYPPTPDVGEQAVAAASAAMHAANNANAAAAGANDAADAAHDAANEAQVSAAAANAAATDANAAAAGANDAADAAHDAANEAQVSAAAANAAATDANAAAKAANSAAKTAEAAAGNANTTAADIQRRADSGEFDGKQGQKGDKGESGQDGKTPVKGVDYFDGTSVTIRSVSESSAENGSNIVTFSDGKTLTVKNGKTPVKGIDYVDGKTPVKGVDYVDGKDGKDGASITVKSVNESSADGGNNIVTFSDGKTLSVKNGNKGADGVSPTVTVNKSGNVTTISVTDKNGTKTATINDGVDGSDGKDAEGFLRVVLDPETMTANYTASEIFEVVENGGFAYLVINERGVVAALGYSAVSFARFKSLDTYTGDGKIAAIEQELYTIDGRGAVTATKAFLNTIGLVRSVNGVQPDENGDVVVAGGGGGAVASVNGKTGAVVLTAGDVLTEADKDEIADMAAERVEVSGGGGSVTAYEVYDKIANPVPLFDEITFTPDADGAVIITDENTPKLIGGATYRVMWNGVEHICVCEEGETDEYGKIATIGDWQNGTTPFLVIRISDEKAKESGFYAGILTNERNPFTISITAEKIIPDVPTKLSELKNDAGFVTKIPDRLPNPKQLLFVGAVSKVYDGTENVNIYLPESYPNPHKLTFTGAVNAEYDGSEAVEVVIPQGGGGDTAPVYLGTVPVSAETAYYAVAPVKDYKKVLIVKERSGYVSTLKTNVWYGLVWVNGDGISRSRSIGYEGTPGYKTTQFCIEYDEGLLTGWNSYNNNENAPGAIQVTVPRSTSGVFDRFAGTLNIGDFDMETHHYGFMAVDPSLAFDGNETVHVWGWPR